jgi:tRNA threonylcarbamoyladenosine biosynthesis protein TsaE
MSRTLTIDVTDLAGTETLGRRLGTLLFPGAVVALVGPLGAGKTHLTRAIAEGAGVENPAAVTSPTFVLIQEYPGPLAVYHFDTYRLASAREFEDLGVEEYFRGEGICVVEWADRVEAVLPADRLTVTIEVMGPTARRFEVASRGETYEEVVRRLGSRVE